MSETLLSPQTYAVFQKVPPDWMDEAVVKDGIAAALDLPARRVAMSMARLRGLNLVERRPAPEVERSVFELRRVVGSDGKSSD